MTKIIQYTTGALVGLAAASNALAADPSQVLIIRDYLRQNAPIERMHYWEHHRLYIDPLQIDYHDPRVKILLMTGVEGNKESLGLHIIIIKSLHPQREMHIQDNKLDGKVDSAINFRQQLSYKNPAVLTEAQREYDEIVRNLVEEFINKIPKKRSDLQ